MDDKQVIFVGTNDTEEINPELFQDALASFYEPLKVCQERLNATISSYWRLISESVRAPLRESLRSIAECQFKLSQDLMASIQESMRFSLPKSEIDTRPFYQVVSEELKQVEWDSLEKLDNDDEVPQEVLSPIQNLLETSTNSSRALTKSDLIGFLSLLLTLFQMFFGSPYEWLKDAESKAAMEQYCLTQQETLDTLKDILDVLQKREVVHLDSAESNVVDYRPDQQNETSSSN